MQISSTISRALLLLTVLILLSACSTITPEEEPTEDQRYLCGQQCLKNGESCSRFFAQKNQEKRLTYEQSKQNFWICLRKYPGAQSQAETPCIPPVPITEEFDSCGTQLDDCLTACRTSLEEIGNRQQQKNSGLTSPGQEAVTEN